MQNAKDISASVYAFYPRVVDGPCRPVVESAREIVEAGFGIDLFLSEYNFVPYTPRDIESLCEIAANACTVTVHTNTFEWNEDKLRAEIPLAAKLGAKVLVVHPGTFGLEKCENPPSADVLRDICKSAADAGVRIAMENSGRTGIEMLNRALGVIGVDSGIGVCIDTGHANRSVRIDGIAAEGYIARFRDLIIEVHINDNHGAEDLHLAPGLGTVNWPAVFSEMRKLRGDAVLCLELARHDTDPIATLASAHDFVRDGMRL